jgi:hypothetical protein
MQMMFLMVLRDNYLLLKPLNSGILVSKPRHNRRLWEQLLLIELKADLCGRDIVRLVLKTLSMVSLSFFVVGSPAAADDLQKARSATNSYLIQSGAGLVLDKALCPNVPSNTVEYVSRFEGVPINATTTAILLSTEMCGGGNKHGQYFYISKSSGGGDLVTDAEIGDMSFLGRNSRAENNMVYFEGRQWRPNDPHCCPSTEGTLEYNVVTRKHAFRSKDNSKQN